MSESEQVRARSILVQVVENPKILPLLESIPLSLPETPLKFSFLNQCFTLTVGRSQRPN